MTLAAYLSMRLSHFWSDLQVARSSAFYTVRDFGDLLEDPFWSAERAWPAYRPALTSYITLPVLAAAIAGAVLLVRRNRRLAVLLLIWIALPTVISFSFTILPFPRHIMYLMPPIIVLAALGIVEAARWCTSALGPPRAAVALTAAGALFLAPSLVWDGRVLADPVAVDYPGLDEWQYVTGTGGGAPWPYLERDMRRRAGEEQVIVITPSTDGNVIRLMLHEDPRFVFVKGTDPRAQTADFAVTDENALPDFEALEILREGPYDRVGRYQRPNGGKVVKLYERNPRL
jgi:hypothetical protein